MTTRRALFALLAAAALPACGKDWTVIEATVESDYLIPSEIDRMVLDVIEGGAVIGTQTHEFIQGGCAGAECAAGFTCENNVCVESPFPDPLTFTVIASEKHRGTVSLVVTGTQGAFTQTPVASARANDVTFKPGQVVKVTIRLRK
jgi:hypothetical protein